LKHNNVHYQPGQNNSSVMMKFIDLLKRMF